MENEKKTQFELAEEVLAAVTDDFFHAHGGMQGTRKEDVLKLKEGLAALTMHLRCWERGSWKLLIPLYRKAIEEGSVTPREELALCNEISDLMSAMPALERALLSLRSVHDQMDDDAREGKELEEERRGEREREANPE